MPFQIVVKVREAKEEEIYSPSMEKQQAEEQLNEIRRYLGTTQLSDLAWLAVLGSDILSAHIVETSY